MLETYLPIIVSLFIIEVLLSVDNALVNATLAESLPEEKRKKALRIGILLGALFRIVALLLASIIIQNIWLKILGGLYLVYLAIAHLGKTINEDGKTIVAKPTYRGVVFQIALADIVFSLDNVISAVSFSDNIYIVMLGVGKDVEAIVDKAYWIGRLKNTGFTPEEAHSALEAIQSKFKIALTPIEKAGIELARQTITTQILKHKETNDQQYYQCFH
jgi:predicted tellurium resistance membrane protein TerC